MKKLIKIQEALKAPKSQFNGFGKYKYRNQEDILEALKPLLSEHDLLLTLTDEVKEICNTIFVEATATITDGKEIIIVKAQAGININKKGMDIAQTFGSSSSYARKYALNAMFLIDDTKDADNQDNTAPQPQATPQPKAQPQKATVKPTLVDDRFDKVFKLIEGGEYEIETLKNQYDLTKDQLDKLKTVTTKK